MKKQEGKKETETLLSPEQKGLLGDIGKEIRVIVADKEGRKRERSMRIIEEYRPVVEAAFPDKDEEWRKELLETIRIKAFPQEALAGMLQCLNFEGVEYLGSSEKRCFTGNPEALFVEKCEKIKEFCVKNQIKRKDLFTLAAYVLASRKLSKINIVDFFSELIRPTAIHSTVTITHPEDKEAIIKGLSKAIAKLSALPNEGEEGEKTKEKINEYNDLMQMLNRH